MLNNLPEQLDWSNRSGMRENGRIPGWQGLPIGHANAGAEIEDRRVPCPVDGEDFLCRVLTSRRFQQLRGRRRICTRTVLLLGR